MLWVINWLRTWALLIVGWLPSAKRWVASKPTIIQRSLSDLDAQKEDKRFGENKVTWRSYPNCRYIHLQDICSLSSAKSLTQFWWIVVVHPERCAFSDRYFFIFFPIWECCFWSDWSWELFWSLQTWRKQKLNKFDSISIPYWDSLLGVCENSMA